MVEVMNPYGSLISFDGRVLELFECQGNIGSKRVHVQFVESIEVHHRGKGLEIRCTTLFKAQMQILHIDPSAQAAVAQLVQQVKAVRGLP